MADAPHKYSSAIHILPTELMLLVFALLNSQVRSRITLTHVCREWRAISLDNSGLWTNVHIDARRSFEKEAFDNHISLLRMQLSRTGELPLDVKWFSNVNEHRHARVVYLIREMAPCSRWRTLFVSVMGIFPGNNTFPLPQDKFPILESLVVFGSPHEVLVDAINRTATSKLKMLDLTDLDATESLPSCYDGINTQISSLLLPSDYSPIVYVALPRNIVKLEAHTRQNHHFPYISTYRVAYCVFTLAHTPHLPNLTTLIITSSLNVYASCEVIIPSLLHLECATITLGENAIFHTPALETLYLCQADEILPDAIQSDSFHKALQHPGFRFLPKTSISIDFSLQEGGLRKILKLSPHLKRADLYFDEHSRELETLKAFDSSEAVQPEPQGIATERMGWSLTELRLTFGWERGDVDFWKSWASSVVAKRKAEGIEISIHGSWKGEDVHIPLG